ncbi:cystatin-F-like [Amblyraja radiata]|uniref:cystatin-F-like n=1 Tax=Amblyraja radiata TaxID=386614 RepID=UPI001403A5B5|nr:cystatin-F-like [Amblyraja radiata]
MGVVLDAILLTVCLLCVPAPSHEGSGDMDLLPGMPSNISVDDPAVRNATLAAVYRYNNASNDVYLFKVQRMLDAQVQIVAGLKYLLHFDIGRTVCRKEHPYNFKRCSFQTSPSLIKKYECHAGVWVAPYTQKWRVIAIKCL